MPISHMGLEADCIQTWRAAGKGSQWDGSAGSSADSPFTITASTKCLLRSTSTDAKEGRQRGCQRTSLHSKLTGKLKRISWPINTDLIEVTEEKEAVGQHSEPTQTSAHHCGNTLAGNG